MLEFVLEKKNTRSRLVARLIAFSVAVHVFVLGGVVVADQLRVEVVPEPSIAITFVDLASVAPPPPPPPPKKRSTPKKVEAEVKPAENVAPKQIPTKEEPPPAQESAEDEGSDDGVEGGVEGGVAGGVVGGVPATPAPPPKPPAPKLLEMGMVRKNRIQGHDPEYPAAAERRGIEAELVAKITIGADGRVTEVVFQKTHPAFEKDIREAVLGWKFQPHIVDGRPVPVYTIYRFVFRLE